MSAHLNTTNGRRPNQAIVLYAIMLVVGIMLAISAIGFSRIHQLSHNLDHVIQQQETQAALMYRMRQAAQTRSLNLQSIIISHDPFVVDDLALAMAENAVEYIEARTALLKLTLSDDELELLEQQHRQTSNTAMIQTQIIDLIREDEFGPATRMLVESALPNQREAIRMMEQFIDIKREQNIHTLNATTATIRQTYLLMLLLGLLGVVSSILIALKVNRRINSEIHQREQTEKELRKRELYERTIRENIIDGVLTLDEQGVILSSNPACTEIFGYPKEQLIGQSATLLIPSYSHYNEQQQRWSQPLTGRGRRFTGQRANGESFHAEWDISRITLEGEHVYIAVVRDISAQVKARQQLIEFQQALEHKVQERTEELVEANQQLRHEIDERVQVQQKLVYLANHDPLTQLPNRARFAEQLEITTHLARRHKRLFALLFLDLDGFKTVNDTHGHAVGDKVLLEVAARLRRIVRKEDMVARMGGDEFTILLSEINKPEDATNVAEKVIEAINVTMHCENRACHLGTSIGICLFPEHADNPDQMLRLADDAMYTAKQSGKNTWRYSQGLAIADSMESVEA